MLLVAVIAFFAGGYIHRSELLLSSQAYSKQLQAKDQTIQSQETQLAQTRQQLNENSNQLAGIKTKLEESQKELSAAQQRLGTATRVSNRLLERESVAGREKNCIARAGRHCACFLSRWRQDEPRREPTRPLGQHRCWKIRPRAARVISQIDRGTRLNVVSSAGDWLEVRSKRGDPPGYVRSDDARLIGGVN